MKKLNVLPVQQYLLSRGIFLVCRAAVATVAYLLCTYVFGLESEQAMEGIFMAVGVFMAYSYVIGNIVGKCLDVLISSFIVCVVVYTLTDDMLYGAFAVTLYGVVVVFLEEPLHLLMSLLPPKVKT